MKCTDPQYEQMLYAYELGLLSGEELKQFEIHLMECDFCYDKVRDFKDAAEMIRFDNDFRDTVAKHDKTTESEKGRAGADQSRKLFNIRFIPVTIAAAIILMVLLLKPWHLEFSFDKTAIAEQNRLAVVYFQNMSDETDSKKLEKIIPYLLITDLSESNLVKVVSSQRLDDIAEYLKKHDSTLSIQDWTLKVADQSNSKWALNGSIIDNDSNIVITTHLIERSTGDVISSQQVTSKIGENIFSVVDKLSSQVLKDLSYSDEAVRKHDKMISDLTTSSSEAYLYYIEGREYYYKLYFEDARTSFEKVLEYDSTFAMAYYYLAALKDQSYIEKAIQYSENISTLDKLYIRMLREEVKMDYPAATKMAEQIVEKYPDNKFAYYKLGYFASLRNQLDSAIYYNQKAIALDSTYRRVYYTLANMYEGMGNLEDAIWALNKYIDLAPDEANPYYIRGMFYARNGQIDKAISSFKYSLEIKPDFYQSLYELANMSIYKRHYNKADSLFDILARSSNKDYALAARFEKAFIPYYQGQFKKAALVLQNLLETTEIPKEIGVEYLIRKILALIYEAEGNIPMARDEMQRSYDVKVRDYSYEKLYYSETYCRIFAENGEYDRVLEIVESLKQEPPDKNITYKYYYALASIAYYQGNYEKARSWLDDILEYDPNCSTFAVHYLYGVTCLKLGDYASVIKTFERQLENYSSNRLERSYWSVLMHYYLGIAYEESRWTDQAIDQYEIFLDIWKEADSGISEIADARARLKRLQSGS